MMKPCWREREGVGTGVGDVEAGVEDEIVLLEPDDCFAMISLLVWVIAFSSSHRYYSLDLEPELLGKKWDMR
jgi:hypothetical protein